jgi:hypothetical protein
MRFVSIILFSVLLAIPAITKFVAFTQCSIAANNSSVTTWCDCMIDNAPTEKDIDLPTTINFITSVDWKFTTQEIVQISQFFLDENNSKNVANTAIYTYTFYSTFFKPPIV